MLFDCELRKQMTAKIKFLPFAFAVRCNDDLYCIQY